MFSFFRRKKSGSAAAAGGGGGGGGDKKKLRGGRAVALVDSQQPEKPTIPPLPNPSRDQPPHEEPLGAKSPSLLGRHKPNPSSEIRQMGNDHSEPAISRRQSPVFNKTPEINSKTQEHRDTQWKSQNSNHKTPQNQNSSNKPPIEINILKISHLNSPRTNGEVNPSKNNEVFSERSECARLPLVKSDLSLNRSVNNGLCRGMSVESLQNTYRCSETTKNCESMPPFTDNCDNINEINSKTQLPEFAHSKDEIGLLNDLPDSKNCEEVKFGIESDSGSSKIVKNCEKSSDKVTESSELVTSAFCDDNNVISGCAGNSVADVLPKFECESLKSPEVPALENNEDFSPIRNDSKLEHISGEPASSLESNIESTEALERCASLEITASTEDLLCDEVQSDGAVKQNTFKLTENLENNVLVVEKSNPTDNAFEVLKNACTPDNSLVFQQKSVIIDAKVKDMELIPDNCDSVLDIQDSLVDIEFQSNADISMQEFKSNPNISMLEFNSNPDISTLKFKSYPDHLEYKSNTDISTLESPSNSENIASAPEIDIKTKTDELPENDYEFLNTSEDDEYFKIRRDKLLKSREMFFNMKSKNNEEEVQQDNTVEDLHHIDINSNISERKCDSELSAESCVNSDAAEIPTNEMREETGVTNGRNGDLEDPAKIQRTVANREEPRSGVSECPDGPSESEDFGMHRIDYETKEHNYEVLKGNTILNVAKIEDKSSERNLVEESDSSEEENSSESSDSSSEDDVIKNDSGFWEGGNRSSSSNNFLSPASSLSGILFQGGPRRLKRNVKWADIDGKTDLTTAESSSSSEDEEEEEVEEDGEQVRVEEPSSSSESSETETEDEENSDTENSQKAVIITEVHERNDDSATTSSSSESEESEDEHVKIELPIEKHLHSNVGEVTNAKTVDQNDDNKGSWNSSGSEEESTDDENSLNTPSKDGESQPVKIDVSEMQMRITDLQRDIENKASNIDRLQTELDSACSESEKVRLRFKRLEEDLELYRRKNMELTEKLQITEVVGEERVNRSYRALGEAEKRIRELEEALERVTKEYNSLQISYKKLQADRDMEVQIIQKALEKALADQESMETKYEAEFEKLRTLNSGREVQMLEDFEWKLREVERNCKRKLQEYETEFEQKNIILANQLVSAQADLDQIAHLKLCEVELNQLKQTSSEQRKNLRQVNRKLEELQVSEKILQEEVNSLRSSLDKEKSHIVALQTMHKEELAEKDRKMKVKMEVQIKQMTNEWEERLRKDCYKIKTELERASREERSAAVDLANKLKDQEISQLKRNWEHKSQDFKNEIDKYKRRITEIESHHRNDLSNAQTNADRELFDLRRKMDKLDMSYQEKIEQIQEKHEAELASLREESEKRLQQTEAGFQMQLGNSRTTLELVKQQLQNDAQAKLERLENEYQRTLERQRIELQNEKELALSQLEESHRKQLEVMCREMEWMKKQGRNEADNHARKRNQPQQNESLRNQQQRNKIQVNDEHPQSLLSSGGLDVAGVAQEIRIQGKEEVLQRSIEQLTKQLNAGKMEIEKLRQQLEAREARQLQQQQQTLNQQQQTQQPHHPQRSNPAQQQPQSVRVNSSPQQQPTANPRRHRKGRSGRN